MRTPSARLIAAAIVLFAAALAANLFVLVPTYLVELGHSEADIGLVMGAFNVASLVAMLAVGRLAGRVGLALPLAVGGALAALGTLLFAFGDGVAWLSISRALQGLGFGSALVGGFAAVAELTPARSLANTLGAVGIVVLLTQALGPAAGELLHVQVGWNGVFAASGAAALASAACALLLPVRPQPIAGPGGARVAVAALVSSALAGTGFGAVWSFLADYAESLGLSVVTPFFLAYVGVATVARLLLGGLADSLGRRAVAAPSLVVQALAMAALVVADTTVGLIVAGSLFGVGHGLSYPALQALAVDCARSDRARAMAAMVFAFGVGTASASLVLGLVAEHAGYDTMYIVAAALSLASAAALAAARQP